MGEPSDKDRARAAMARTFASVQQIQELAKSDARKRMDLARARGEDLGSVQQTTINGKTIHTAPWWAKWLLKRKFKKYKPCWQFLAEEGAAMHELSETEAEIYRTSYICALIELTDKK
jgi:hypothetical protein